jgi:maleate isomerase
MWQADGWGWRARLGVLMQHADVGPESELRAMAPEGVSIHAARIRYQPVGPEQASDPAAALEPNRVFAEPPYADDAAALLAAAPLHAIMFAFTSNSYVRGAADDAALKARLEQRTRGIPVVITCAAAVVALRALGVRRLALIAPPWFLPLLNARGADYFRSQGFEVVYAAPADLPRNALAIHPGQVYEWVRAQVPASAEAVFIGGNGFRTAGAIQALEEDLERPVLTANQVALWQALHLAGTRAPVVGYGQIFTYPVPEQ